MCSFVFVKAKLMRNKHKLLIEQLDKKLNTFMKSKEIRVPGNGWIHSIRSTLNMTLQLLGNKLNMSSQGVSNIEKREASGSITL